MTKYTKRFFKTTKARPSRALRASLRLLFLSSALISLTACGARFKMWAADDFVVLDEHSGYDYRATTPEGLVIAVRDIDNERSHGELPFWTKAIEDELRLDQGYALLDTKSITTRQGHTGTQLRFGLDREGEAHIYIVSIFVTKKRVFLIEAGGTEAQMKRHHAQIEWSVNEFVIRRG